MEIMSTWVPSCNPQLWHGAQVHSNPDSRSATLLSISEFIEFSILEFISHQFHYYHITNVSFFEVNSQAEHSFFTAIKFFIVSR